MALEINARDFDNLGTIGDDESLDAVSAGVVVKKLTVDEATVSGTGTYTPFLRQNATGSDRSSQGFNTDDSAATANNNSGALDMDASFTQAIRLSDLAVVYADVTDDGVNNPVAYYELRLDINEENNDNNDPTGAPNAELGLTELQIYTSDRQAVLADYQAASYETRAIGASDAGDFQLRYDIDSVADTTVLLNDTNSGSGRDDYVFYIPLSNFAGVALDSYFTLFSQFGPTPVEGATFEEWRIRATSEIFGTKFDDANGNGVQDSGEGGLAGFTFYIDTNNNNVLDVGEQTAVSDASGAFAFYGLQAGTYTIREVQNGDYVVTTGNAEGDHIVTITTFGTDAVVKIGNFLPDPEFTLTKVITAVDGGADLNNTAATADDAVDSAGDVIHYQITLANTGNVALTAAAVLDLLEGTNYATGLVVESQAANNVLDVGESWSFLFGYTVTQDDIDTNGGEGLPGTGFITNVATATAHYNAVTLEQGPVEVNTPIVYDPELSIDKVVVDVDGRGADASADDAGDVITYRVTVRNDGNVTLTGVVVADPLTGLDVAVGTLAPGASYVSDDLFYVVQQSDIDENGPNGPGDGDIDNTATADSNETDPVDDSEDVPVVYDPQADVEKLVSLDGVTYTDEDNPTGPLATLVNDPIFFQVMVANTGNTTLTEITLADQLHDYANNTDTAINYGAVNAYVDLDGDGIRDLGEGWGTLDANDDGTIDNLALAPGESLTVYYELPFAPGQHTNTVTLTTAQNAGDSDAANYFGLIEEGPGVRTPGFWQNPANGGLYWDGIDGNEPHDDANFPDGELRYPVDSNNDGAIDGSDIPGLLIGDYDMNGIRDPGEDVLFISYDDASQLIDASNKKGNDGTFMLGRDVVATWLNYLAGNNIDPTSSDPHNIANAPHHFIDDAIDWLQEMASDKSDSNQSFAKFVVGSSVKTSSNDWKVAQADDGIDHSGAALHSALGSYNEDGTIKGEYYAGDADAPAFLFALTQMYGPDPLSQV